MFTTLKPIYSPQNRPSTPQMRKYFDGKQSDLSHTQEIIVSGRQAASVVNSLGQLAAPFAPSRFRHRQNRDNKKPAHLARVLW
jgi:cytidylate kinase